MMRAKSFAPVMRGAAAVMASLLVLTLVGSKKSGPKANGLPYRKEER